MCTDDYSGNAARFVGTNKMLIDMCNIINGNLLINYLVESKI